MDDFVSKPIMAEDLVEVLSRWLPDQLGQGTNPDRDREPASSSLGSHAPATLDIPGMLSRLMGDELLAVTIMDGFAYDMPGQIQSLLCAAQAGCIEDVANLAHRIRGAAANIGGEALRQVATEIERLAGAGDLGGAKALMDELDKQFTLLMQAIAAHHPVSR
jgi:HPt (histidine-containing phosphotransfer) domain-containing protein